MHGRLDKMVQELVNLTRDCRPDMHEPDEQGLYGRMIGDGLDNACVPTLQYVKETPGNLTSNEARETGDYIRANDLALIIEREKGWHEGKPILEPVMVVNLCDLIAAVRMLHDKVSGKYEFPTEKRVPLPFVD